MRCVVIVFASISLLVYSCAGTATEHANRESVVMSFDDATKGLLNRSVPLKVALPRQYKLFVDEPVAGTWMWTSQAIRDAIDKNGAAPANAGVFQARITTELAYDQVHGQFFAEGADEQTLLARMRESGLTDFKAEKLTINNVPVLLLQGGMAGPDGKTIQIYMAYVATLVSTNVVLVSYRAPSDPLIEGPRVWGAFVEALRSSGTTKVGELASGGSSPSMLRLPPTGPHGRVDGETYIAPDGLFTVALPVRVGAGGVVDDSFEDRGVFSVSFSDDFGVLRRIDGLPLNRAKLERERRVLLTEFFDEVCMETFRGVAPNVSVTHAEYMPDLFGGALLRVVSISGGSTLAEMDAEGRAKRLDSTRGVLVYVVEGYLFEINVQEPMSLGNATTTADHDALKRAAVTFANTIKVKPLNAFFRYLFSQSREVRDHPFDGEAPEFRPSPPLAP